MLPFVFILCALCSLTGSLPAGDLLVANDSELVGSTVKEVQAPAPFEDLQSAGTVHKTAHRQGHKKHHDHTDHDEDNEKGYYKSKSTKGDDGYKHFDSFHKKDGDKYGYEAHSSFGYSNGGKKGGSQHAGKVQDKNEDGGHYTHGDYHDGESSEKSEKLKRRDHEPEATEEDSGEFYYGNFEAESEDDEGEHDDVGHYTEEADEGHYEDDGSHEADSEGYHEGAEGDAEVNNGESENYHDGSEVEAAVHHGGPSGATSYYIRHY